MKIVISGYFGFGNAGDEAILEAMLVDLRAARPDVHPVVLSGDPLTTAARFDVEAVPRLCLGAVRRALRDAALFISGGGSLLQDVTGWGSVPYYAGLITLARWLQVPVFVYAQGIGPLRRPWMRALAVRAVGAADEITVRDRLSYETLRQLGVDPKRMSVVADPVFGLATVVKRSGAGLNHGEAEVATRPGGMSPVDAFLARAPSAPIIGVSLRPLPGSRRGDADDAIVESVAAVLKPRLSRWNAYVLPLPLYGASDGPVLDRLRRALGETAGDRILEWSAGPTSGHLAEGDRPDGDRQLRARQGPSDAAGRHLSAADWLHLFARLDLCVTMRLHGLIFAASAGTPFVALSDDPKVEAHVDELGVDRRLCLVSPSSLSAEWTKRGAELPSGGTSTRPRRITKPGGRTTVRELGAVLDAVWSKRSEVREQLKAVVPDLAARARLTAVRALRLAQQRGERG